MLESLKISQADQKALKGADAKSKANLLANGAQDAVGAEETFASELEANLALDMNVKPVEVSPEQLLRLPSSLIDGAAAESGPAIETASPKIFDPALTRGIEKLIQPQTTEVGVSSGELVTDVALDPALEVSSAANAEVKKEISQALLKTPQVSQSGKAVATSEVAQPRSDFEPQLLNLEDVVSQKNAGLKKNFQPQAYGMTKTPQESKVALENGLTKSQIINEIPTSETLSSPVNSQEFILSMMSEQKTGNAQGLDVQPGTKVFDMNHVKTSNAEQVMTQITDYIVQAKAAKEPTVNMRVNHDQLGMIDITVSRGATNHEAVAINIGAHTTEGKSFFLQNSKELSSHLASAGFNVSDLKIETPTQLAKNDFDFGQQTSRQGQAGADKQFGSEQNQRRHEQDRRQDLWKLLNQEAA